MFTRLRKWISRYVKRERGVEVLEDVVPMYIPPERTDIVSTQRQLGTGAKYHKS